MKDLTADDVIMLQDTWNKSGLNVQGEQVLYNFFTRFPKNQIYFEPFMNIPLDSLRGTSRFRSHSVKIMRVFDESVSVLSKSDYKQQLKSIWTAIGTSHENRNIPKESFKELRIVLIEMLTSCCNMDDNQKQAWNDFFDNIFELSFKCLTT